MATKTDRVALRISPEMKRHLQDAASALGMSLGTFLIFCAAERAGETLGENILKRLDD